MERSYSSGRYLDGTVILVKHSGCGRVACSYTWVRGTLDGQQSTDGQTQSKNGPTRANEQKGQPRKETCKGGENISTIV